LIIKNYWIGIYLGLKTPMSLEERKMIVGTRSEK
jgi:hypothetical protein